MWTLLLAAAYARPPAPPPAPPAPEVVAETLIVRALSSSEPYDELATLCDDIGNRLAGSPSLDRAIEWAQERMRQHGLANVHTEPVTVHAWIRGDERFAMTAPRELPLHAVGLGNSIGTPAGGIDAEVWVVGSFDELAAHPDRAKGRVVLFDVPFTTYGETVGYRFKGASEAAKVGAVAALVRSVAPSSLDTPHTGVMVYDDAVPKIPSAAVTLETAEMLERLQERGIVPKVHLEMGAHWGPDAPSANVVGEVRGRELPDEVVVLGCHLDSWDVGQGAQDDGAGCATVMGAVDLVAAMPVPPRRTLRVVLFTNEENGLAGGDAYRAAHANEHVVAALEVDTGAGQPLGVGIGADELPEDVRASTVAAWEDVLRPWSGRLEAIGAGKLSDHGGGADIGPIAEAAGIPVLGLEQDMSGYWPIHHTQADTFDKIDPLLLARNVAAAAVTGWALADAPSLPAGHPAPPKEAAP